MTAHGARRVRRQVSLSAASPTSGKSKRRQVSRSGLGLFTVVLRWLVRCSDRTIGLESSPCRADGPGREFAPFPAPGPSDGRAAAAGPGRPATRRGELQPANAARGRAGGRNTRPPVGLRSWKGLADIRYCLWTPKAPLIAAQFWNAAVNRRVAESGAPPSGPTSWNWASHAPRPRSRSAPIDQTGFTPPGRPTVSLPGPESPTAGNSIVQLRGLGPVPATKLPIRPDTPARIEVRGKRPVRDPGAALNRPAQRRIEGVVAGRRAGTGGRASDPRLHRPARRRSPRLAPLSASAVKRRSPGSWRTQHPKYR